MFLAAVRMPAPTERHPDGASNALSQVATRARPSTPTASEMAGTERHGVRVGQQRLDTRVDAATRRMEESAPSAALVGIDWPWLAIASGSLSYRPSPGSLMSSPLSSTVSARLDRARSGEPAIADARLIGATRAEARPLSGADPAVTSATGAPTCSTRAAQDDVGSSCDEFAYPHGSWPADVRELIERRRLQIVDEGGGSIRLLVRDFHMATAEIDRWAESIHRELQAAGQSIRVLWINGRHYDFPQGEPHDR
jgi:hypothetical protein